MANFQEKNHCVETHTLDILGNLAQDWAMLFRKFCLGGGVSVCREEIKCPDEEEGRFAKFTAVFAFRARINSYSKVYLS